MEDASIQPYLEPGETLWWSGSPRRQFRFGPQHAPLVFTLIAFAACFIFPLIGLLSGGPPAQTPAPVVSSTAANLTDQPTLPPAHKQTRSERIGGAIFFFLFFGSIAGMILYSIIAQVRGGILSTHATVYAVTNQRIIIVTGKSRKRVTSLLLTTLSQVQMQQWPDGLGTISFGPRSVWPTNPASHAATPSLENISDSGRVFQLIAKGRGPA